MAHSQGTAVVFFAFGSMSEYYKNNVNLFVALGPVARVTRLTPLNEAMLLLVMSTGKLHNLFNIYEVFNFEKTHEFVAYFCNFNY